MRKRKRSEFAQFLVDQTPKFDELILGSIHPEQCKWIAHIDSGPLEILYTWKPKWMNGHVANAIAVFNGARTAMEVSLDRFNKIYPDLNAKWEARK